MDLWIIVHKMIILPRNEVNVQQRDELDRVCERERKKDKTKTTKATYIKTMDTRIGLDYIVENREYVIKLGAALDTNNVTVKKQVFELLSALCAYNNDGYNRALETLDHYKVQLSRLYLISFNLFQFSLFLGVVMMIIILLNNNSI